MGRLAAGCARFTVHARTAYLDGLDPKANRTVPPLRYDLVYLLKRDFPHLAIELNGGVRSLDDIRALRAVEDQGIEGVITGQAIYTGALDLAEAIRVARG